jgi:hypothetical protein
MKAALVLCVLLASCAAAPDGVQISDDEAQACKAEGCTVWTNAELLELARTIYKKGYEAGRKSL